MNLRAISEDNLRVDGASLSQLPESDRAAEHKIRTFILFYLNSILFKFS